MPSVSSDVIALTAVIVTGVVSLSSIAVPLLVERIRWNADRRERSRAAIETAANKLLTSLSLFRTGNASVAAQRPATTVQADLLSSYYAWRLAVLPYCTDEREQERIRQIGADVESHEAYQAVFDRGPQLAAEVLDLTARASARVK